MVDILGIGIVTVDDFLFVDRFPQPDSKLRMQSERREMGGLTAVALVAAARQGAQAAFGAVLGPDPLSQFCIEALEAEGIDCSHVLRRAEARPTHAYILVEVPSGLRTIVYTGEGSLMLPAEWASEELVRGCKVLFVDMAAGEAGARAAQIAHRCQIPVVGDFEHLLNPFTRQVMAEVDHLIVGQSFAAELTGLSDPAKMAQALAEDRQVAVVTAGAAGGWYSERGQAALSYPAFRVQAVNTTGCGDVFHGAYAACLARRAPLEQAIRTASAAAALKAASPGGCAGIPTRRAVEDFLRDREPIPGE